MLAQICELSIIHITLNFKEALVNSNNSDWPILRKKLVEVLKEAEQFHSGSDDKKCFLTAYQLAVLLYKKNKSLVISSSCPKNIGGKGEGSYDSLSRYIANMLAKDLQKDIKVEFINISGLEQFSFRDEDGIIKEPSNTCFSMFRYIG